MARTRASDAASAALRKARRAWRLLLVDAPEALAQAESALHAAQHSDDRGAQAWALLARGVHGLHYATPAEAEQDLRQALALCGGLGERAGELLATVGLARVALREGQVERALAMLRPLRDEGLAVLRRDQRGMMLNAIAGCHSAQGDSERAFAYLYEALRGSGPARGNGFDIVVYCNLSHELVQIGDHDEALAQVERGLERCRDLRTPRLRSVLLINRVICLTELERADEALASVREVAAMPLGARGRGAAMLHFEAMAVAALRAGATTLGAELLERARAQEAAPLADERVELAVAQALLARARGDAVGGLDALRTVVELVDGAGDDSASLRVRCLHARVASELRETLGEPLAALHDMRRWQRLNALRARLASRARYQAAALQTELLELRHRLEENDARRRATERARAELAAANAQLSQRMAQIESLQAALREQATHDALTGLGNRRLLGDALPPLVALALRERWPLAVALIDLDHFKAVNDAHGHDAGDRVLAAFGRLLGERLRASDKAFRYGGEEFCVLLPHTHAADAAVMLEELLAQWRSQVFALDVGTLRALTFSAGVADTGEGQRVPTALLKAADARLLAAKRVGRACVVVRTPAAPTVTVAAATAATEPAAPSALRP
ncbi:MAG: diguanylate cyclase [Burkholderiales bacterium]|nr:diguanylate cyclase [Burkholderiales bacterium]